MIWKLLSLMHILFLTRNNFLIALAKRNVPLVLCGKNHNPVGILWSVSGHYKQAARMDAQIRAKKPLMKRIWKKIIQAKIAHQAQILEIIGKPAVSIKYLISKVSSGDMTNIEALAARKYWNLLFSKDFRRDRTEEGINSMLNYGYMVVRATVARSIMAAGLHPTLGINHSNANNPMRLADDLIEPFRPLVDLAVFRLSKKGLNEVNSETKKDLVKVLLYELKTKHGRSAVSICIQNLATSLGQIYTGEKDSLDLPIKLDPQIPDACD